MNSRAIVVSALAVAIGFLAGIILNVGDRQRAEGLPWSDPVIWSSGLMLAWLVAAAIFNGLYRPARRGRKVAYLTVVSFAFLVLALAVLLLVDTQHSGQKQAAEADAASTQVERLLLLPGATAGLSSSAFLLRDTADRFKSILPVPGATAGLSSSASSCTTKDGANPTTVHNPCTFQLARTAGQASSGTPSPWDPSMRPSIRGGRS